jgi:hypothetical protein
MIGVSSALVAFALATFGAGLQELVHWYELRNKLDHEEYARLLRSRAYWVVVLLMIVGSGIGTAVWCDGGAYSGRDYMVFGAAFPLLMKKAVAALDTGTKLGRGTLRDYLR